MESITDCAFSWPISALSYSVKRSFCEEGLETYVGSSPARFARGFDRCCVLFGRTWSRA